MLLVMTNAEVKGDRHVS